jgi:hypothetical protein
MKDIASIHFEDDMTRRLREMQARLFPIDRLGTSPEPRTPLNRGDDGGGGKDEDVNPSPDPPGGGGFWSVIEGVHRIHSVTAFRIN